MEPAPFDRRLVLNILRRGIIHSNLHSSNAHWTSREESICPITCLCFPLERAGVWPTCYLTHTIVDWESGAMWTAQGKEESALLWRITQFMCFCLLMHHEQGCSQQLAMVTVPGIRNLWAPWCDEGQGALRRSEENYKSNKLLVSLMAEFWLIQSTKVQHNLTAKTSLRCG